MGSIAIFAGGQSIQVFAAPYRSSSESFMQLAPLRTSLEKNSYLMRR